MEKAKVASQIKFDKSTAFLSQEDVAIAAQLRGIYPDVATALNSVEAAGIRAASGMRQLHDFGQQVNQSLFVEFGQNIRQGMSAWDAFKNAGLNALGKIADKLMSMAADQLFAKAFSGGGGGFGFLSNLFSGGAGGAAGAPLNILPPMYASGTDYAKGGLSLIGENGPELLNIPRGSQIVPNDVLRQGGMGSSISAPISISIDARGADAAGLARVQGEIARLRAELPSTITATVRKKQYGGVL